MPGTETRLFDHEGRLSTLESEVRAVKEDVAENTALTKEVLRCIKGNNGKGLTTKVALNCQSINRIWWVVGAVFMSILGIAFYVIQSGIDKAVAG